MYGLQIVWARFTITSSGTIGKRNWKRHSKPNYRTKLLCKKKNTIFGPWCNLCSIS